MAAARISAIISASAEGSKHLTEDASTVARSRRQRAEPGGRLRGADLDHVAHYRDPDPRQQGFGAGTRRNPRRRLARRGALEDVAGVVEAVLLHAGEVRVTRTRLGQPP